MLSTQSFCFTETSPSLAWRPGVTDDGVRQYIDMDKRRIQVYCCIV